MRYHAIGKHKKAGVATLIIRGKAQAFENLITHFHKSHGSKKGSQGKLGNISNTNNKKKYSI